MKLYMYEMQRESTSFVGRFYESEKRIGFCTRMTLITIRTEDHTHTVVTILCTTRWTGPLFLASDEMTSKCAKLALQEPNIPLLHHRMQNMTQTT